MEIEQERAALKAITDEEMAHTGLSPTDAAIRRVDHAAAPAPARSAALPRQDLGMH